MSCGLRFASNVRAVRAVLPLTAVLLSVGARAHAQTYTLSTLAAFDNTTGSGPGGLTVAANGDLYGATFGGGPSNNGSTIFKVAAGTNTLATVATFDSLAGTHVSGRLTQSGGDFYGVTSDGGLSSVGTLFRFTPGTNTVSTLYNFSYSGGFSPRSLLSVGGTLYGTTYFGGPNNQGTVFSFVPGTSTLTNIANFTNVGGQNPNGNLIMDSSGNLYGTTEYGGSGQGTIFKIAVGTNTVTTLLNFNTTNGANPHSGLTLDNSGNLYGTTYYGGANDLGTVFKLNTNTNAFTILVSFNNTNGSNPNASLTLDAVGNLFGTTQGITNGNGSVFKINTATNAFSTIAAFPVVDGGSPNGGFIASPVTLDSGGNVYGTAYTGGAFNRGTIFKLTPSGVAAAPEPGTLLLFVPGIVGFAAFGQAKRSRRS